MISRVGKHVVHSIWGTNLLLTLSLPELKCGGKDLEAAVILALVWAKLPGQRRQKIKAKELKEQYDK